MVSLYMRNTFHLSLLTPESAASCLLRTHAHPQACCRMCIRVCDSWCYSRSGSSWHLARGAAVLIVANLLGVYCCPSAVAICISLMVSDVEHLFIYFSVYLTSYPLVSPHGEMSLQAFCPYAKWSSLVIVEFWEFFTYARYWFFVRCVVCKYFLPLYSLSLTLLTVPFTKQECVFWWSPEYPRVLLWVVLAWIWGIFSWLFVCWFVCSVIPIKSVVHLT